MISLSMCMLLLHIYRWRGCHNNHQDFIYDNETIDDVVVGKGNIIGKIVDNLVECILYELDFLCTGLFGNFMKFQPFLLIEERVIDMVYIVVRYL